MRRMRAMCAAAAMMTLLSGCGNSGVYLPTAQDITNVELIRVMGLDKGEEKAVRVSVSASVDNGTRDSAPEPPAVLSEEGETVFAACLAMQTLGDSYVSYSAVDQCLIHESAVEQELSGLLDYLERDYEMRMDADLFLATGNSAKDYLQKMAEATSSAADRLASVARDYPLESQGWEVKVRDVLIDMADNGCALVPVVALEQQGKKYNIRSDGMAWVDAEGVQQVFRQEQARGVAILCDKAEGGCVEVQLDEGTVAGLRLTEVGCRWEPQWAGEQLVGAVCQVAVKADIAELRGDADPAEEKVLRELEKSAEVQLKGQMEAVLHAAQRDGADFFRLRRKLCLKSPRRSAAIENAWEQWYPSMKCEVQVDCTVERSYDVERGTVVRR